jgi:translation initiation factor 4B
MSHELKDVKEYLQHDLTKDDAPKTTTKAAWGKPQVAQTAVVQPAPSLLEIEAEQQKEKERIEEQRASKPGAYQAKHGAGSYSSPHSAPQSVSSPGAYTRPERTEGPSTTFESFSRGPRQQVPVPSHPPFTAYIGNLPFNISESEIGEYFEGLDFKEIRLVKNSDGRSKGFAFVEFASADGLRSSLSANNEEFHGRRITVEVQPPRQGGERNYGGSSTVLGGDDDKSRWGPSSGSGFASQLGSQAGSRTFENRSEGRREGGFGGERREGGFGGERREGGFGGERREGGFGGERREGGFGGSRGTEDDSRQWRGKETPYQPPVSTQQQQRPKIDLKPRTVTDEVGKLSSSEKQSSSEDPFGGALNPEKAKRQAEIQAQREAEASAKHKVSTTSSSGSKFAGRDGERERDGRGQQESHSGSAWRSQTRAQDGGEQQEQQQEQQGGDKYRFNRGSHPYDQRAPQKSDNQKSTNNSNPSSNTFSSLAGNSNNKW